SRDRRRARSSPPRPALRRKGAGEPPGEQVDDPPLSAVDLGVPGHGGSSTRSALSTTVVTLTTFPRPASPSLAAVGTMAVTRPTKLVSGRARAWRTTG